MTLQPPYYIQNVIILNQIEFEAETLVCIPSCGILGNKF
jgi:hypothetical protein